VQIGPFRMSSSSDQNYSSSVFDKQHITELCEQFKARCDSGARPPVEDFLREHLERLNSESRTFAFREVLRTAFESGTAEQIDIASLRTRFPEMVEIIDSLAAGANETIAFQAGSTSVNSKLSAAASSSSNAKPPETLGRYRLEKELGRGGMGAVYLARDTKLDRLVALKVPTFGGEDADVLVERFYREARTMAAINHVNLCTVHDVCEIDGFHCLVMEFVDGGSLCGKLEKEPLVPLNEAVTLTAKLARALQLAHDAGVVHRDIKPANILLRKDNEPVLTDFGLARMLFPQPDSNDGGSSISNSGSRLTQSGALIGTPMYMSPEQVEADHDNMGPATDIYSLGVVMYLLISGRLPFEGSVARVLGKIVMQEPPPPATHNPLVDQQLEAICLKAMAKKPDDRYASAADLAETLEDYLQVRTSGLLPESTQVEEVRSKVQKPVLAIAGFALVAVLAVVVFEMRAKAPVSTADLPSAGRAEAVSDSSVDVSRESESRPLEEPTSRVSPDSATSETTPPSSVDLSTRLPSASVVDAFESASGLVTEDFAVCFQMSMPTFQATIDELRSAGFEPKVVRPYAVADGVSVAAIWRPGSSNWDLQTGMTLEGFKAEGKRQVAQGRRVSSLCANQKFLTAVWTEAAAEEPATWKYIESTNRPEQVYDVSDPLVAKGLRPFTVHGTPRQGLNGVTQIWKPESGNWELVRSRSVASGEVTYDPGDGLLEVCLLPTGPTQCGGIFIWQDLSGVESKLVVANDFVDQTEAMQRMSVEGWNPVSLMVALRMRGNNPASASVWHRKVEVPNTQ